jgi:hypothetical protein
MQLSFFKADTPVQVTTETEDEPRTCKTCKEVKPITEYSHVSGMKHRHHICKKCKAEEHKLREALRKENPLPSKDYCCPICLRKEEDLLHLKGKRMKTVWSLDHCWETKKFRAYLCHGCNRALGILHDNPDTIQRALDYINEHNDG